MDNGVPIEAALAIGISLISALAALWWASREIAATRAERIELIEERRRLLSNPEAVPQPISSMRAARIKNTDEIAVWEQSTIGPFGHWRSPCAYCDGKIIDTISGTVVKGAKAWMRNPPPPGL